MPVPAAVADTEDGDGLDDGMGLEGDSSCEMAEGDLEHAVPAQPSRSPRAALPSSVARMALLAPGLVLGRRPATAAPVLLPHLPDLLLWLALPGPPAASAVMLHRHGLGGRLELMRAEELTQGLVEEGWVNDPEALAADPLLQAAAQLGNNRVAVRADHVRIEPR